MKLRSGPITRLRKTQASYAKEVLDNPHSPACAFCNFEHNKAQVLKEYDYFWLANNSYPYSVWDGCKVVEHLMIIPKRHVTSLNDMNPDEDVAYTKLVKQAEKDGYSIYTRSNANITKSVPHVHTHFIKTESKRISKFFYSRKPHIVLFK